MTANVISGQQFVLLPPRGQKRDLLLEFYELDIKVN